MTGDLRFHEGSFGTRLIESDVTRRSNAFGLGGRASTRCRGWGWGVAVDEARVARHATERVLLPEASTAGDDRPEPWSSEKLALALASSR